MDIGHGTGTLQRSFHTLALSPSHPPLFVSTSPVGAAQQNRSDGIEMHVQKRQMHFSCLCAFSSDVRYFADRIGWLSVQMDVNVPPPIQSQVLCVLRLLAFSEVPADRRRHFHRSLATTVHPHKDMQRSKSSYLHISAHTSSTDSHYTYLENERIGRYEARACGFTRMCAVPSYGTPLRLSILLCAC